MFWLGRINAVTGLVALSGGLVLGLSLVFPGKYGPNFVLIYAGLFLLMAATVIRFVFSVVDMFYRAFLGKPLVYQQRLDIHGQSKGQITE